MPLAFNNTNQMPQKPLNVQPQYTQAQPTMTAPIFMWVNGSDEATRAPVPANGWAFMMDRSEDVFYVKRCDSFGNAYPLEIYDFTKRVVANTSSEVVGRDEFNQLNQMVTQMSQQMSKFMEEFGINKEAKE